MAFTLQVILAGQVEEYEVEGEITETLDFFDAEPGARVFTTAARLDFFDLPSLVADGITPDMAVVRVYRGDELVLSGQVQDPRWSSRSDTRFKVVEEPWAQSTSFPPSYEFRWTVEDAIDVGELQDQIFTSGLTIGEGAAAAGATSVAFDFAPVVTTEAFSSTSEKYEGRVYPVVFGAPGKPDDGVTSYPGSPALFVDTTGSGEKLMICMGETLATGVSIWGKDNNGDWQEKNAAIFEETDANGRKVQIVDAGAASFFGLGGTDFEENPENDFYVSWQGAASDVRDESLPGGLGDVIEFCLNQTHTRVDRARIAAYKSRLNQYRVDCYVDETVDIAEWLLDNLEPYPVRLVAGRYGVFPWLFDPDEPAVLTIEVGQNAHPDGDLRLTSQPPLRQYEVRYRHDDRTGNLTKVATAKSLHAEMAGTMTGSVIETVESNWIAQQATAELCARQRVRALGQRNIVVSLVGRWDVLGHLTVGDPVELTYTAEGLTRKKAIVTKTTDTGEDLFSIELVVLTDVETWKSSHVGPNYTEAVSYDFPAGAWAIWNPYEDDANNIYSAGTSYTQIADVSGNGRHMSGGGPVNATSASYPGKNGSNTVLPVVGTTTNRLKYNSGVEEDLFSHTVAYAGPYDNAVANSYTEFQSMYGTGVQVQLFQYEWYSGSGGRRQMNYPAAGAFGTNSTGIASSGGGASVEEWHAWAYRCTANGATAGSSCDWVIYYVTGDASSAVLEVSTSFSESSTMASGSPFNNRERFTGCWFLGSVNSGVGAIWTSALSDADLKQALIAAASQISTSRGDMVRDLLG